MTPNALAFRARQIPIEIDNALSQAVDETGEIVDVNALQYAFLGPLVGALSRSMSGWVSDKFGGGRVTLWVFLIARSCKRAFFIRARADSTTSTQ